jgi:hypothetical protein
MICVMVFAQVTTTPNLQLALPAHGTQNYDVILNSDLSIIDNAIGILQLAFKGAWINSTQYSKGQQVSYLGSIYVSLINGNFNNTPSSSPSSWSFMFPVGGTVTSVGDISPFGTWTTRTTTPTFVFTPQLANTVLAGPTSGSAGAYSFRNLVAADLPSVISSNTTGTANSLSTTPTLCATGNYARGVDAFGNAQGCTAAGSGGGGPATLNATSHLFINSYNSGTLTFGTAQPAFSDLTGTATSAQLPSSVVYNSQTNTFTSGSKQVFTSSTTTAGEGHAGVTADPSSLTAGDQWYRSDLSRIMLRSGTTTQQLAFLSDIPTAGAAGTFIRSNGTSWATSTIQTTDVPTLNQNTTGKAQANVMSWSTGITGSFNSTTANTNFATTQTTVPGNITVVSFTMALGTSFTGCTTFPVYQLWDNTAGSSITSITMTASTLYFASTGLSVAVTSGHAIILRLGTAGVGCTAGNSPFWTVWYTMT